MSWNVQITRSARKELSSLPTQIIVRIDAAILKLEDNPHTTGARKLRGISGYRFRMGRYRILYDINRATKMITIYGIRHRRDAYR